MRTLQLAILPLAALVFVFFIYRLAEQYSPPGTVGKSPIKISELQILVTAYGKNGKALLAAPPPRSAILADGNAIERHGNTDRLPEKEAIAPVQVKMFSQKPFLKEKNIFLPSDRIYLVMEFGSLDAGRHLLSASWINPDGDTVNTADHIIDLNTPAVRHRSYFWLELMKNGGFTELITGREYKGNVYGTWRVEIHLDGKSVARHHFQIRDI